MIQMMRIPLRTEPTTKHTLVGIEFIREAIVRAQTTSSFRKSWSVSYASSSCK